VKDATVDGDSAHKKEETKVFIYTEKEGKRRCPPRQTSQSRRESSAVKTKIGAEIIPLKDSFLAKERPWRKKKTKWRIAG